MNVLLEDRAPAVQTHRAMARFPIDRRGAAAGLAAALLVILLLSAFAHVIWRGEARALGALLRMSGTPFHTIPADDPSPGLFGGIGGGETYAVAAKPSPVPAAAAYAGLGAFALASAFAIRSRRVPVPAKVLWLLFAVIGSATLWHNGFVSGDPPNAVNAVTIGFQRGGLLIVVVAALLFAFEIFPVPGPLKVKAGWLAGMAAFALAWSVVRMAFVLATVHHLGSWTFLYLQYIAGPVVDFLAVVAFYSLATHGLARRLEGSVR